MQYPFIASKWISIIHLIFPTEDVGQKFNIQYPFMIKNPEKIKTKGNYFSMVNNSYWNKMSIVLITNVENSPFIKIRNKEQVNIPWRKYRPSITLFFKNLNL